MARLGSGRCVCVCACARAPRDERASSVCHLCTVIESPARRQVKARRTRLADIRRRRPQPCFPLCNINSIRPNIPKRGERDDARKEVMRADKPRMRIAVKASKSRSDGAATIHRVDTPKEREKPGTKMIYSWLRQYARCCVIGASRHTTDLDRNANFRNRGRGTTLGETNEQERLGKGWE